MGAHFINLCVWVRCFVWNLKDAFWNSAQNIYSYIEQFKGSYIQDLVRGF